MTSQEKKAYLNKYRPLEDAINRKLEECAKWRDMAEKVTPTLSDMPKAKDGQNRLELAVERIVEIEQEIQRSADELVRVRQNIEASLQAVKDDRLRELLVYRYIDGLTWEKIAVKMDCSYQWVCMLHGKALNKFQLLDSN